MLEGKLREEQRKRKRKRKRGEEKNKRRRIKETNRPPSKGTGVLKEMRCKGDERGEREEREKEKGEV